jgi:DHA1 family multidrug resistance protein-like MFS transporter
MLSMALLSPKLGSLSDRIGRKKIIMWGLFGDVVLGILTGLAPDWIWLLLIRVLNGAGTAAAMLPSEALLIDLASEHRRGEASGFVMAMVGRSVGPAFGGFIQWTAQSAGLSIVDSYRVPYFVDSLLALLALVLVAWRIREPKHVAKDPKILLANAKPVSVKLSRSIKVLLLTSFVAGIGVGFIAPVSVLFYNDKFGIEPIEIGSVITLTGFVGIAASWLAGRVSDKIGRKPMIALGGIGARISTIVLPLTSDINQAVIVMSLRSIGFNLLMPASRALRADIVPAESRGKIFGMFTTAFTAGGIVGPIVGTWLYDIYRFETVNILGFPFPGYGISFLIYSIIGITSVILILAFVRHR